MFVGVKLDRSHKSGPPATGEKRSVQYDASTVSHAVGRLPLNDPQKNTEGELLESYSSSINLVLRGNEQRALLPLLIATTLLATARVMVK